MAMIDEVDFAERAAAIKKIVAQSKVPNWRGIVANDIALLRLSMEMEAKDEIRRKSTKVCTGSKAND